MPAPPKGLFQQLAKANFLAKGIKLPMDWSAFSDVVSEAAESGWDSAKEAGGAASEAASAAWDTAQDTAETAKDAGEYVADQAGDAAEKAADEAWDTTKDAGGAGKDAAEEAWKSADDIKAMSPEGSGLQDEELGGALPPSTRNEDPRRFEERKGPIGGHDNEGASGPLPEDETEDLGNRGGPEDEKNDRAGTGGSWEEEEDIQM